MRSWPKSVQKWPYVFVIVCISWIILTTFDDISAYTIQHGQHELHVWYSTFAEDSILSTSQLLNTRVTTSYLRSHLAPEGIRQRKGSKYITSLNSIYLSGYARGVSPSCDNLHDCRRICSSE